MKTISTVILIMAFAVKLFATAQYADIIFYKGKKYSLLTNPLESYFEKNPDSRPKGGVMSTALWRGYVATFEIRDNQLFLEDIEIQTWKDSTKTSSDTEWKSVIDEVFPYQKDIKVDWLTGLLVLPYGEMVNYVHMGYGSTYKNYILIEIDKGDFKREVKFNYKEYEAFKEKQFQAFKTTDEYKKLVEELKKESDSQEFIDSFLKDFVTDYTTKILTE